MSVRKARGKQAIGLYARGIEFEWGDARYDTCFLRRGFDFAYAVRVCLDPHRIVVQDRRLATAETDTGLLSICSPCARENIAARLCQNCDRVPT